MTRRLMTEAEIHNFGLQLIQEFLEKKGFTIELIQPDKNTLPHIIAKKEEQLTFVLVATDVYPKKGVLTDRDKAAVLDHAKQFNAQTACASIGIVNAEGVEKKDKRLMGKAYGDAPFMADFSGLEFIQFED